MPTVFSLLSEQLPEDASIVPLCLVNLPLKGGVTTVATRQEKYSRDRVG